MGKKRRDYIIASLCIAVSIIIIYLLWQKRPEKTLVSKVDDAYHNMEKVIEYQLQNNEELSFSSNPYAYIIDNEYYKSIVDYGMEVVPILESKLRNDEYHNGLFAYITAIAIESITVCDLKNEKETAWATADEFIENWTGFVQDAKDTFSMIEQKGEITKSDMKTLQKYGKLAVPLLEKAQKEFILDEGIKDKIPSWLSGFGMKNQRNRNQETEEIENYLNSVD